MSPWWDRDDEDEEYPEISAAWFRKHGNLRVPPDHIRQAWRAGKTGLAPSGRTFREEARRRVLHADGVHPDTKRWTAPWKPMPTGQGRRAQIRSRWRQGSEYAKRAGRTRSYYKTLAARENGRRGGLSRSLRKTLAARINGRLGGLVRSPRKAECARRNGLRGGRPRAM